MVRGTATKTRRCPVFPARLARLKWFINFINSRPAELSSDEVAVISAELAMHCDWALVEFRDPDELSQVTSSEDTPEVFPEGSERHLIEYAKRIHGYRPHNPEYYAKEAVFWVSWYAGSSTLERVAADLEVFHEALRTFFLRELVTRLNEVRDYCSRMGDPDWTYCFEFDDPLSLDRREASVRIHTRIGLLSQLAPRNQKGLIDFKKGRHRPINLEALPFEVTIIPPVNSQGVIFKFIEALGESSLSDLGECEECKKWFVRTSKREKRFCCHGCSSRNHSRRKIKELKESDSDEYLKELAQGRERAHRSYVRKAKNNYGPNVKVTRRSRDGKDKEA
jgi:hypothetical protein